MDKFEKKMKDAGLSQAAIAAFRMNYDQLAGGATGLVGLIVAGGPSDLSLWNESADDLRLYSCPRRRSTLYQSFQSSLI